MLRRWSRAAQILENLGAECVAVSLEHTRLALPAYYVLAPAEASSNLARFDGVRYGHRADEKPERFEEGGMGGGELFAETRAEGFGEEVKRRIMLGTFVLREEWVCQLRGGGLIS